MTFDPSLAQVLIGLFGVINTALLVYQAVRLGQVHTAVDGAHAAAVEAAHNAGVVRGLMAAQPTEVTSA
jgi:hypothetical protein